MKSLRFALLGTALAACAFAADPDVSKAFSVNTDGTTQKVAAGQQGTLKITFHTEKDAHISNEAPLKITLAGKNLTPSKATLRYSDSLAKTPEAGKQFPDPRFEVPFTAMAKGQGTIDAKMSFFVCTEQLCSRQEKTVSIPVEVQ
jgi:hypothetical protein